MISIPVKSSSHTYNVCINNSLYSKDISLLATTLASDNIKKIAFIYDHNCSQYFQILKTGIENHSISVFGYEFSSGEKAKSIQSIYPVFDWLIQGKFDRTSAIAALGGGVTGDAVGFIASVYLRGVPFFQFPTTLLSMVDSSVGGKVAINHELGKNLIGSFYPPKAVYIDTDCLSSLPQREFSSGLAECVKHAVLDGESTLEWMEDNVRKITTRDTDTIKTLLESNIRIKASIVEEDERESGKRAYLNLGHTFAHALEKHFSYSSELLHGEAVSLGLLAAAKLSHLKGTFPSEEILRLEKLLLSLGLPIRVSGISASGLPLESLIEFMKRDKKVRDDSINFVLINGYTSPYSTVSIEKNEIISAWNYILN